VLTESEIGRVFEQMRDRHLLMVRLIYGSGMRLTECIRLRNHWGPFVLLYEFHLSQSKSTLKEEKQSN